MLFYVYSYHLKGVCLTHMDLGVRKYYPTYGEHIIYLTNLTPPILYKHFQIVQTILWSPSFAEQEYSRFTSLCPFTLCPCCGVITHYSIQI